MHIKLVWIALGLVFGHFTTYAQKEIKVNSPDGNLTFIFKMKEESPTYAVIYKNTTLIGSSSLGLDFGTKPHFTKNLRLLKPSFRKVSEQYDLIVGKTKTVKSISNEAIFPLIERAGDQRQVNLVVRIFNDGVAFKYEIPEQKGWTSYTLLEENTTFAIEGNPKTRALQWGSYNNSHEGYYQKMPFNKIQQDTLMDMPALFEYANGTFMAITEANLRDYAGMYLRKKDGYLTSQLSPLPNSNGIKVKAMLPHQSPWRVMLISDQIGDLIASNIITTLCDPPAEMDYSWIKPGKTSFHWWNGDITPDTTFAPGINFQTNKYYIDFCAQNNIEYHSVIGYGGFPWYVSDAAGYGKIGPHTDVTRTVATLDMQQVCDYAKQKGVDIHVWVHWEALYNQLEEAFIQFEKWGIKGMMVDFMNRDDQEMVNIQEEILKSAARHKLFIQFHGTFKPTGLSRTYPNEFTREGTYNYEVNKFNKKGLSPDHDLDMPFTRLLAGPTDYHLGGFRAVKDADFKRQYTRPLMTGTRCHMLAQYVVLESYLVMVADYPEAYLKQPGFDFLQQVPTTWDETKVPAAKIEEYVSVARRKGKNWYMGVLNSTKEKTIQTPLSFLGTGKYRAKIYEDANGDNPNHLIESSKTVSANDTLDITMAPGGGQVVYFKLIE